MGKVRNTIATSAGFSLLFLFLGCSSGTTKDSSQSTTPSPTPNITQVLPRTITAGSQATPLTVTGTNFSGQSAILWNGAALPTTQVDAGTLTSTVPGSNLANPATVQLQVQNTQTMQSSQTVPLTIAPANTVTSLTISTTSLPSGTANAGYSATLSVSGGTAPYTWSISTGQLPAGLTLAPATGAISGTPTTSGNYSFGVTATDSTSTPQSATATITLSIAAATSTPVPLAITSSSLAAGTVGSGYSSALQASGGSAPYTWSITSGSLPTGLSLAASTGLISGTPTASGTSNFTAAVADSSNPAQNKSASISLTIAPAPIAIVTSTLPSGTVGTSYSNSLQAIGGTTPYSWAVTNGSLPAGLSIAVNGTISGTPTTAGTSTFTVTLTDGGIPAQTKSATVSLTIAFQTLTISTSSLPAGTLGTSYSNSLQATGGTTPYTWSIISGSLPAGLSIAANGTISGTPTAAGTSTFTAKVTDAGSPAQTKSASLSLTVASNSLAITSSSLGAGTVGSNYSATLQATGGTSPYKWTATTGSLPAGLTLAASTGVISGKPTTSGNFSFGVTAMDSSPTVQSATATIALTVAAAATPLTISSTSVSGGTTNVSYSSGLSASGGTTPYTWSISSGSLPAGLSIAANGTITGTPTAVGTSTFTASVSDSGSPVQSKSVNLSLAVTPGTLSIATSSLPAGTASTAYSTQLAATGGTPAYTWSIASGSSLPAGLTLAATTGIISGTPTTAGTYSFTATASDNGSPVQTASVKTSITVAAATTQSGSGTTWYIRNDGGTRYSANVPAGQCDGQADLAYPGTGTNQHCAFNDFRFLYDDQSYGNSAWVIAGGDTVIVRGGPWRIGFNQGTSANDVWCSGGNGRYGCSAPTIPAGTPTQHTRILGENYASCSTGNTTNKSSLTQIFGGYGVWTALPLTGAQYVDVQCLEITRHSQCITHGYPQLPGACSTSTSPIDDYDSDGINTDLNTHDLLLQDMWIHGHTDRGIIGPIGGLVTCTRCEISYNGMAGWDFDPGNSTPSPNGTWNISYSTIAWNGCNQEYPLVDAFPATSCYSQSTGGYGDGVGTPPGFCMNVSIDHSTFAYNTQDGLDLGHLSNVGPSGVCTLNITNSYAYANGGATFKWGAGPTAVIFTNNLAEANCNRMAAPLTGAPNTYNANLSDFCRSGDAISFNLDNNATVLMTNNTFVTYAPTSFDVQCNDVSSCAGSVLTFENNLTLGYADTAYAGAGGYGGNGSPGGFCLQGCNGSTLPIGTITRNNNLYFGVRETCGATELCQNPLLVNQPTANGANFVESELDNFNFNPSPGSPAIGAGLTITGVPSLLLDYNGLSRPSPPSIGAVE